MLLTPFPIFDVDLENSLFQAVLPNKMRILPVKHYHSANLFGQRSSGLRQRWLRER